MPATAVLMPTTSPAPFTSAPPELPGLSAASVWMTLSMIRLWRPTRAGSDRPSADTTPAVTDPANPCGLPIATTSWPTRSRSASPSVAGVRSRASARRTARSDSSSRPTISKLSSRPSTNEARPPAPRPATTCAFDSRKPSGVRTTALPPPEGMRPPRARRGTRRVETDGASRPDTVVTTRGDASSAWLSVGRSSTAGATALRLRGLGRGQPDRHLPLLGAAHQGELDLVGLGVERCVDVIQALGRRAAGRHDQVAALDARGGGGAAVLDTADQQAVDVGQADRPAQPAGHVGRRDGEAQVRAAGRVAAAECVDAALERLVGGQ